MDLATGDTASLAVGNTPQQIAFTRGRLLVMNANLDSLGMPAGESWISVVDPVVGDRGALIDSIPLIGPGNAPSSMRWSSDGLVYVVAGG